MFSKKTGRTPKTVIEKCKRLFREYDGDWKRRPQMPSSAKKKARIKAMGGRVTTVEEWLDLTPEEVAIIDMKIRLGKELKTQRKKKRLSQEETAKILNTSQGRVSKMERGQATIDQLAWSLLRMGESEKKVARVISG